MKNRPRFLVIILIVTSLLCIQSACYAQNQNMLRKLGRGVSNVTTGVFEIPIAIQESFYDDGPMAAATYGVLNGIWKCTLRTIAGVFEVVSFPLPVPTDYAPIVQPEFLFSPDQ